MKVNKSDLGPVWFIEWPSERTVSIWMELSKAAQRVANAIAQESQENRDLWNDAWIQVGSEFWVWDVIIPVWNWWYAVISWSIDSWIIWEILDPEESTKYTQAIIMHHAHPWRAQLIPVEILDDIIRRDRERRNTIEWEIVKWEDDE